MAIMCAAAFKASAVVLIQDNKPPHVSTETDSRADELAEWGETLKAAVLSGALSEEDAMKIYSRMTSSLAPMNAKKTSAAKKDYDGPYSAKIDFMMLSAPRPDQISALLQPEFLWRDLQLLRSELNLDRSQMAIIEILLTDYLESQGLTSLPFREALGRHHNSSADQWIAAALERVHIDEVDVAVANTRDAIKRFERATDKRASDGKTTPDRAVENQKKRTAQQEWAKRMVEVTAIMDERIEALRQRVNTRLAELENAGSMVTADDLVKMARRLRSERTGLGEEFVESLGLVCLTKPTETEQAIFDMAIARIRIGHDLNKGRLGGESMNLWTALIDTTRADESKYGYAAELDEVKSRLDNRTPEIAAILDKRTQATIDREISGLEFLAERDRLYASTGAQKSGEGIDPSRLTGVLRPFARASHHELTASVAVRDKLLELLDETTALIDTVYPDTSVSMMYRDLALRSGFRTEVRQRWLERALNKALQRDDLDEESHAALVAIETNVAASLRALREDAIAERIRRDPQRARQRIDVQLETRNPRSEKLDLEDLLGFNHKAYKALDERIEGQLKVILTPEQFATLPPRSKTNSGSKAKAGKKKQTKG